MGSKTGVADRATEGAGDPDALRSLGLIDRCLDNALPDTADTESGSGGSKTADSEMWN